MRSLPWSISTTVRNPDRLRDFLRVLAEFEGKQFNPEVQQAYQIRLIQERLYSPTQIPESLAERFNNPLHQLTFEETKQIFEYQQYKDPPMRGRQSANPLNKLGLAVAIERLGSVRITPAGRLLLDDPSRSSEVLFRCLLKLQYPNPLSKDFKSEYGFHIRPLVAVLRLIEYLRARGKQGLTREEFCYFTITWLDIRNLEEQAERILKFGSLSGAQQTEYLHEWLAEFYGTRVPLRSEKVRNLLDYGDNAMRYFRYTKYFTVESGLESWTIDREPTRAKEIDMLLQEMDGTPLNFKKASLEEYLEYLGNPELPRLPWQANEKLCALIQDLQEQARQLGFVSDASSHLLEGIPSPLSAQSELEQWLSELRDLIRTQSIAARQQQSKWQPGVLTSLQATLLKIGTKHQRQLEPADLEKLITDILMAIDDAEDIFPNYPMDDLGNPISHAPGNCADIECYYKDFRLVVEVTLDSSKNQWFREGQPVMRHLREFEKRFTDDLPAFCLFLAPRVHQDTYSQFWFAVRYEYDGRPQKIVPLDFQQFGQVLDVIIRCLHRHGQFASTQLLKLLQASVSVRGLEGYNHWRDYLRQAVNQWCEAMD